MVVQGQPLPAEGDLLTDEGEVTSYTVISVEVRENQPHPCGPPGLWGCSMPRESRGVGG